MKTLHELFENNKEWVNRIETSSPGFFKNLAKQQNPEYLWIGCSDSRVPANEIVGLAPGELFVHRNIANLVIHSDMNCLSVLQFAIDVLKIKHIIVCGHYGCGGIKAALENKSHGLVDNWLRHIRDIYHTNFSGLQKLKSKDDLIKIMCELNVIQQVTNVCSTTFVQDAWRKGVKLSIHGWIYSLSNGLLRDLDVCVTSKNDYLKLLEREKHY